MQYVRTVHQATHSPNKKSSEYHKKNLISSVSSVSHADGGPNIEQGATGEFWSCSQEMDGASC